MKNVISNKEKVMKTKSAIDYWAMVVFFLKLKRKAEHPCRTTCVYQKGITLIALIITIILMLILAGVVINMTFGENGLFLIMQTAVEKTVIAELKEKANIEYVSLKVQNYETEVKLSQVVDELRKQGYKIITKNNSEGESRVIGVTVTRNPLILDIEKTR